MPKFTKLALVPTVWLLAVSTACISEDEFSQKRNSLDEDGDGCPFSDDCDDADGSRGNCLVEIPYDGVDNDCSTGTANLDEVDVDGDSIPGIPYATWIENGGAEASWPDTVPVVADLVDCRDVTPDQLESFSWVDWSAEPTDEYEPTTHVDAASIYPGAADSFYDGLDSDCAANNDFDADGDGYMPPAADLIVPGDSTSLSFQESFDGYVAEWGYTFTVNYGDCFDIGDIGTANVPSSSINPGVLPEDDDWYDGIDLDCLGNNDFDQDGDGYLPNGYEDEYIAFVELHYGVDTPPWGSVPPGVDCLDQDDSSLSVAAALIYPDAVDLPYNGVDEDCDTSNDFDQDLDFYRAEGFETEYAEYETNWTYSEIYSTTAGDCDDNTSTIYPGALEIIGDGNTDTDCDGGGDSAEISLGSNLEWDEPSRPVVLATNEDYILAVSAREKGTESNVGVDFTFEKGLATYSASQSGQGTWFGPSDDTPLAPAADAIGFSDRYYAGGSYYRYDSSSDSTTTYLYLTKLKRSSAGSYDFERQYHANLHDDEYQGMDIVHDGDERVWVFACGSEKLHFMTVEDSSDGFKRERFQLIDMNILSEPTCFLSPAASGAEVASGTVCSASTGCTTYDLDRVTGNGAITEAATSPWESMSFVSTVTNEGMLIAALSDGGVHIEDLITGTQHTVLESHDVVSADAVTIDDITYVVFVSTSGAGKPDLFLAYGELGGSVNSWTEVEFDPNAGNDKTLQSVSLYGDAERLFLSFSASGTAAGEDVVGWTFVGLP